MTIRGGQKIKKFEFELACKLPPFYVLSWFQKYKDQLWTHMGSASSGNLFFDQERLKIQRKWP